MFTGIVQGRAEVRGVESGTASRRFRLAFPAGATDGLQRGASVAIAGVCLTAVTIEADEVEFDVIDETLDRTTLGRLERGDRPNFERAARFGDEVGGHVLSGHVWGLGTVVERVQTDDNCALTLQVPGPILKYVFEKGYVAIDGTSLTVGTVDRAAGTFRLHLIPETLQVTTLGTVATGDVVNVEVDATTQAVVDTVERVLAERAG